MDNDTLKLIARLKIQAARAGVPIDVVRLAGDRSYARGVLARYSDGADEEGTMLALQVMDRLGLMPSAPPPVVQPSVDLVAPTPDPAAESRYVGRLR